MALPGFIAENVFHKTTGTYVESAFRITPTPDTVKAQRVMSPEGPIGLPGQGPCEVCWHMCMTFGGGNYNQCAAMCGNCTGRVLGF